MILGRIVGTVVSSIKHPVYEGKKVLIVQPEDTDGRAVGRSFLAVDAVQAGIGDRVLAAREGNTARQILGTKDDPFHSVIVGIVDQIQRGQTDAS